MINDRFNDGFNDGFNNGFTTGRKEANIETAKILLRLNKLTIEEISESTQLTLEEVKRLEQMK
jgi:predicted transposase YdaD